MSASVSHSEALRFIVKDEVPSSTGGAIPRLAVVIYHDLHLQVGVLMYY